MNRKIVTAVGALLLSIAGAHAQEGAAQCTSIENDIARLACFDRHFAKSEGAEASEPAKGTSVATATAAAWEITESKSPLDDSPVVLAVLSPTTVRGTGVGDSDARLVLRCSENTTSAVVSTSMFMSADAASVTTRLDTAEASTSRWATSSNYKAAGLWTGAKAIPFIKSLVGHSKLVIRVEERNRVDAQFDLANVEEVAKKIGAACNW